MVTGYQSDSYSTNVIYEYDSDEKLDFEHYYQKSLNLGLCKYDIKYQFKKIYRYRFKWNLCIARLRCMPR